LGAAKPWMAAFLSGRPLQRTKGEDRIHWAAQVCMPAAPSLNTRSPCLDHLGRGPGRSTRNTHNYRIAQTMVKRERCNYRLQSSRVHMLQRSCKRQAFACNSPFSSPSSSEIAKRAAGASPLPLFISLQYYLNTQEIMLTYCELSRRNAEIK